MLFVVSLENRLACRGFILLSEMNYVTMSEGTLILTSSVWREYSEIS